MSRSRYVREDLFNDDIYTDDDYYYKPDTAPIKRRSVGRMANWTLWSVIGVILLLLLIWWFFRNQYQGNVPQWSYMNGFIPGTNVVYHNSQYSNPLYPNNHNIVSNSCGGLVNNPTIVPNLVKKNTYELNKTQNIAALTPLNQNLYNCYKN